MPQPLPQPDKDPTDELSAMQGRENAKHKNCKHIIDNFHSESSSNQLFYLKTFMKARDLLEAEVTKMLREKGCSEDDIVATLNKINGKARFSVNMEFNFALPDAPSEKSRI